MTIDYIEYCSSPEIYNKEANESTVFTSQQWDELSRRFEPKVRDNTEYNHINDILKPVFAAYNGKKTSDANWSNIYKRVKLLEQQHVPEIDSSSTDVSFCIFVYLQILLLIIHQPGLFNDEIDCSEWDYIVKFWGLIMEQLFFNTTLRLKWGDTHITLHDTIANKILKVDMRVLNDKINQRYNVENDVSVMEASEEAPGEAKFVSDRCKLSIENKTIIDRLLLNGVNISSIESLQISGLEIFFVNTCLEKRGLYETTETSRHGIDNTLNNLKKYLTLAINLLHFRDDCVAAANTLDEHLIEARSKKKFIKRPATEIQDDELTIKQESIRGTWIPPRTSKTPPPEVPPTLCKN
ncbi:unnamed protein product [Mucor hiemalis]